MQNSQTSWLARRKMLSVIGVGILAAVVLIVYYPAIGAGLYADDWMFLEKAGRATWPQYLIQYFDPQVQGIVYRPLQGILFWIDYVLFRSEATGYHISQIVIHLMNCLLLGAIVRRVSGNARLAFLSALIYAGWSAYSWAVIWPAVVDPLAVLFYLLATWFWIVYLQSDARWHRVLAYVAFALLLLSKETGLTLPVVLAALDLLILKGKILNKQFLYKYIPFVIILLPYLSVQWYVQTRGWFARNAGYSFGSHVIGNLVHYSEILVSPWDIGTWNRLFLIFAVIFLFVLVFKSRNRALMFLIFFAIFNLLPVIGFAPSYFQSRFSYLSMTAVAVGWAWLFEWLCLQLQRWHWNGALVSMGVVFLLIGNGFGINDAATTVTEKSREERVPFRNISQRHPSFPPGTFIYIIGKHDIYLESLSGMFFWRYGQNVSLGSTNDTTPANLRDHPVHYVYYFDETGQPIELPVGNLEPLQTSVPLPVTFSDSIRLEGYEPLQTQIRPGMALVILLYWRTQERIARDYTVFAHLIDANGETVVSYDSQPKQGTAPTTIWPPGRLMIDSVIMPIPSDVPTGTDYRLELGLYYLPTMEQLEIVDAAGNVIADSLIIAPFKVVE